MRYSSIYNILSCIKYLLGCNKLSISMISFNIEYIIDIILFQINTIIFIQIKHHKNKYIFNIQINIFKYTRYLKRT